MTEEKKPVAPDDGTRWCSTCKLEVPIAPYCTNCGKDLGAFRGYTSGKTHRDPAPNIDNATGRRVRSGFPVPGCTWTPRPEYDNHNPILAEIRELQAQPWHDRTSRRGRAIYARYLRWVEDPSSNNDGELYWSPEHRTHARRVLSKLAALA